MGMPARRIDCDKSVAACYREEKKNLAKGWAIDDQLIFNEFLSLKQQCVPVYLY